MAVLDHNAAMHKHWVEAAQREGRRVGVVMGAIAAATNPMQNAPMVVPATVMEPADQPDTWWLLVELTVGYPLPQMYRESEILGLWRDGVGQQAIAVMQAELNEILDARIAGETP